MTGESDDYHDYVIREGELVGRFEEMYQNCTDPWHQDKGGRLKEAVMVELLTEYERQFRSLLDIGCGKGRFTRRLVEETRPDRIVGIDVSPTALHVARTRVPRADFVAGDIPPIPAPDASFDLVVAAELLWYVIPSIDEVLSNIRRVMTDEGILLVSLYFPHDQEYGNEVMERPEELIEQIPLEVVKTVVIEDLDTEFIGLFRR